MVGQTFGPYRIITPIGRGGMGVVYKAYDVRLDRLVALKTLPEEFVRDPDRRQRFLQEARAASALSDPHITVVHDIFTHEATDFLVMEFVAGQTLHERLRQQSLSIGEAVGYAVQIADGVSVAHAAGIVHRDLKPGNLMVTDRGAIKILDFGLAKQIWRSEDRATRSVPVTQDGLVLGTLEYMSPEQVRGDIVDERTDIFALGAILHEMLTGRRLFSGDTTVSTMHAVIYGAIDAPSTRRPEVPAWLDAVVLRALERDCAKRFATMSALADALRAEGRTATATVLPAEAPLPEVAVKSSRARFMLWSAGVTIAALVVAAALLPQVRSRMSQMSSPRQSTPPAATATPGEAAEPRTPYELTERGFQRLRRFDRPGAVDAAAKDFEAAITIDPSHARAWAGLSRANWRNQRLTRDVTWKSRALDAARQAVKLDELMAPAHVSLALALLDSGDVEAAKAAANRALVLDPNHADAHRVFGELAERSGDARAAAAAYARAINANPTDWELPRLAGNIPFREGRYEEALEWYEKTAAMVPDSAVPHRLVAATQHMLGNYPAAAAAIQKSIAIQPTASAYTTLGTSLFYEGRYLDSVTAFDKAVNLQPSDPLMWGNLADAYRWAPGNRSKSIEPYERAITLLREQLQAEPVNPMNQSRLALYLAKSGKPPDALARVQEIPELDKRDVNTIFRVAVVRELAGQRDEALRLIERALERGYSPREVAVDPELAGLRNDARYHRMAARVPSVVKTR